jgi:hypothetical protein
VLTYVNETAFYRRYLKISYEFGSHLRRAGVLEPQMVDERPLCDLHRGKINAYRAKVRQAKEGVAVYG